MDIDDIIVGALDKNIVKAIDNLDKACDSGKAARRFILCNALLFIRKQHGFETQLSKSLEVCPELSSISPIVHAEED